MSNANSDDETERILGCQKCGGIIEDRDELESRFGYYYHASCLVQPGTEQSEVA